jgi:ABC-type Fe3+ transport system permease subunit
MRFMLSHVHLWDLCIIIIFPPLFYVFCVLGKVGWGDVDWIGLAQDRNRWRALVNSVFEPSGSMKCWETIEWPNI